MSKGVCIWPSLVGCRRDADDAGKRPSSPPTGKCPLRLSFHQSGGWSPMPWIVRSRGSPFRGATGSTLGGQAEQRSASISRSESLSSTDDGGGLSRLCRAIDPTAAVVSRSTRMSAVLTLMPPTSMFWLKTFDQLALSVSVRESVPKLQNGSDGLTAWPWGACSSFFRGGGCSVSRQRLLASAVDRVTSSISFVSFFKLWTAAVMKFSPNADGRLLLKIPLSTRLQNSGLIVQKPPFPGSSFPRGTFWKHLLSERLWRMEC